MKNVKNAARHPRKPQSAANPAAKPHRTLAAHAPLNAPAGGPEGPEQRLGAVFAALALIIQPFLLTLRATDLTQLLHHSRIASPGPTLVIAGFSYDPVAGAVLTIAQMIAASVFLMDVPPSPRRFYLRVLSGLGWVVLSLLELTLSVCYAGSGIIAIATAFALTLLYLLFESMSGILIIEYLVIPAAKVMADWIGRWFNGPSGPSPNRVTP